MSAVVEALYLFDEHNNLLLSHVYTNRPAQPQPLLSLYLQHASPRPALIYLPSLNPPTLCHSIIQDNLLILSPTTSATNTTPPLLILEFLHHLADTLQEFLGSPLLATKISANYDIVAQILGEIADGGVVCSSEPSALRDVVETGPGVLKNLLGSLGAAGSSPALGNTGTSLPGGGNGLGSSSLSSSSLRPQFLSSQGSSQTTAAGSAIPWRRSNVRHTSNELYVDIIETLSVTLAPSGLPLAAFAHGNIVFTSKVSGVPDLVLTLTPGKVGGGGGVGGRSESLRRLMQRVVFHPCVRLSRWKGEGVMSFVPPDGRFALAGYEVDLLGEEGLGSANGYSAESGSAALAKLGVPASLEVSTCLGREGSEFEVRVFAASAQQQGGPLAARSPAATSLQSHLATAFPAAGSTATSAGSTRSKPNLQAHLSNAFPATSAPATPQLEDLIVRIPLPADRIRNIADLRPSKGEAHWNPSAGVVEWKIPSKEFAGAGAGGVVLRCGVLGLASGDGDEAHANGITNVNGIGHGPGLLTTTTYDYDEGYDEPVQRSNPAPAITVAPSTPQRLQTGTVVDKHKDLMPQSATLSFSLKGSLPSGLRVESLIIDTKKSRGLGVEIKPYKGVKYVTVSESGVEVRC